MRPLGTTLLLTVPLGLGLGASQPTAQNAGARPQEIPSGGGTWNGPGDTVRPPVPGEGGSGGEPGGGGAGGGLGGGEGTGGPLGGGGSSGVDVPPSTGGSVGQPGAFGPALPRSSDLPLAEGPTWLAWWRLHEDEILDLRAESRRRSVTTPEGYFLGRGERPEAPPAGRGRPRAETVRHSVLPELIRLLGETRDPQLQAGLLVAIASGGRALDPEARAPLVDVIRPFVADDRRDLGRAAVIALGILGAREAAPLLAAVLADADAAHDVVGQLEVPETLRSLAALALGFVGQADPSEDVRRYGAHHLLHGLLDGATSPDQDREVAELLALGLVPLADRGEPWPDEEDAPGSLVGELAACMAILDDGRAERYVRAQAASSLARLFATADPARGEAWKPLVVPALLAQLGRFSSAPVEVRQSAALALGLVGDADEDELDRDVRQALSDALEAPDELTRGFAILSLAQVAARPGSGERPDGARYLVERELLRRLARGRSSLEPWTALALGLFARSLEARALAPSPAISEALTAGLRARHAPDDLSAYCLAAGLTGDPALAEPLAEVLTENGRSDVRGYAALALALIGGPRAGDLVQRLFDTAQETGLGGTEHVALAYLLVGGPRAQDRLLARIEEEGSQPTRRALLAALGRLGDARAVEPLLEPLRRREKAAAERAWVALALGRILDPSDLPWHAALAPATHPTLTPLRAPSGLGILDAY